MLAFGAILPHEAAGLNLGIHSPRRRLNDLSGRCWSAAQWMAVLAPYYATIVSPAEVSTPSMSTASTEM